MDNGDRTIDDWLSGEECDPTDYDLYEIEQYKRFMGLNDDDGDGDFRNGCPDNLDSGDSDSEYDEYDDSEE